MTCYMRHMDRVFAALALPSDAEHRRRVDEAVRIALALPAEARCPEVWSAVKALDDLGRSRLLAELGRLLETGDSGTAATGSPRRRGAT